VTSPPTSAAVIPASPPAESPSGITPDQSDTMPSEPGSTFVVPTNPPVANVSDETPGQSNTVPVMSAPTVVPLMVVPTSPSAGGVTPRRVMTSFSQATVTGMLWVIFARSAF
jgi:hypothetical protein